MGCFQQRHHSLALSVTGHTVQSVFILVVIVIGVYDSADERGFMVDQGAVHIAQAACPKV